MNNSTGMWPKPDDATAAHVHAADRGRVKMPAEFRFDERWWTGAACGKINES